MFVCVKEREREKEGGTPHHHKRGQPPSQPACNKTHLLVEGMLLATTLALN